MIKKIIVLSLFICSFYGCERQGPALTATVDICEKTDKKSFFTDKKSDDTDSVNIKIKMEDHAVSFNLSTDEMKTAFVSEKREEALKKWWDSLPKPLQSQIKSNEVEIVVVSNIVSNDKAIVKPELTDTRIENTGALLEKIIGEPADMTFTVNTKLLQNQQLADAESTNIILLRKTPVKLTQFSSNIQLSASGVNSQNIQSLQYWWMNLPEDIKLMIQRKELQLELNIVALDKGIDSKNLKQLGLKNEEYGIIVSELLHDMIGYRIFENKKTALGQIKVESYIEKSSEPFKSDYLIRINLKNNKVISEKLSL
jgi:hypothetical protein